MIPAETHPLFTPLVRGYVRSSLRGHFGAARLRLAEPDAKPVSTLLHATHVSWWDGYLGLAVADALGLDLRALMLSRELRRYAFLRYGGAFGFEPGSAAELRAVLRYAAGALRSSTPTALLVFPAGEIGSPYARPLPYQPGAARMALAGAPAAARAVAWRLEHLAGQRPEAFVRVGPPRRVEPGEDPRALASAMRTDLTGEADALDADLRADRLGEYRLAMRGRAGVAEGWDAVRRLVGVRV